MIPVSMQASRMKQKKRPLVASVVSISGSAVEVARARDLENKVVTTPHRLAICGAQLYS